MKAYYDDMPAHQSVKRGTIKLKEMVPIILLNDHYTLGSYPQIWYDSKLSFNKVSSETNRIKIKIPIYRY